MSCDTTIVLRSDHSRCSPSPPPRRKSWALPGGGAAFAQNPLYDIRNLGVLDSTPVNAFSRALGMNDKGEVVGESTATPGGEVHAFIWLSAPAYGLPFAAETMIDLTTLAGQSGTGVAHAINESGLVVGSQVIKGEPHAFVWDLSQYDPNDVSAWTASFAPLDSGKSSIAGAVAYDVNDDANPIIVGDISDTVEGCAPAGPGDGPTIFGFRIEWDGTPMPMVETLAPVPGMGHGTTHARAVSSGGPQPAIVGRSTYCAGPSGSNCANNRDAAAWGIDGGSGIEMPPLTTPNGSWALDINELDEAVGSTWKNQQAEDCDEVPVVWEWDGVALRSEI